MMTSSSLDPRKSPWKRGDVCTSGSKKTCFVLDHTPEYLEVRWMGDGGVERISTDDIDRLFRVAHADSLGPDGSRTNLEYLQAFETLDFMGHGIAERTKAIKSEKERQELDRLARRIFSQGKCRWDAQYKEKLMMLIAAPGSVGIAFKIRERIHRIFCAMK
jgi:hypothetical protein